MIMPAPNANEAGPVAAESSFESFTETAKVISYTRTERKRKRGMLPIQTPDGILCITGRTVQRTVIALLSSGRKGVTALELSSWAFRLGAYVHILRTQYGLHIETIREEHDGGFHGRYFLKTPVVLLGGAS